jgi:hypothetical protein
VLGSVLEPKLPAGCDDSPSSGRGHRKAFAVVEGGACRDPVAEDRALSALVVLVPEAEPVVARQRHLLDASAPSVRRPT